MSSVARLPIGRLPSPRALARKGVPTHQPEIQDKLALPRRSRFACASRDEKGQSSAPQAGTAAIRLMPGVVSGVVADEDGAGVDDIARRCSRGKKPSAARNTACQLSHHGVAQRIADGQRCDAGSCPLRRAAWRRGAPASRPSMLPEHSRVLNMLQAKLHTFCTNRISRR